MEYLSRLKKSLMVVKHKDAVFVALFSFTIFTYVALTCTPRCFSDDDWGIANYFVGVLGAEYATPYNKFINFILGWIMYGLYQLLPGPNWFIVVQEMIVVLSFALFQYMLISKMKNYIPVWCCYLLSSSFLAAFEPSYICRLGFTQTAALGSITGMCWMVFCHKNQFKKGFVFGAGLTALSAFFRFGSFEMCLPFAGVYLLSLLFRYMDRLSPAGLLARLKEDKGLYLSIIVIFLTCFAGDKLNAAIYNSDYYEDYNAFNSARASVLDYPKAPYQDIAEELQEIGVSENDYNLIMSWTLADLSFITTDLLKSIEAVEPKAVTKTDYGAEIDVYFTKLQDSAILYNKLFYMALIILIICLILDFGHMIWYAPTLLAGAIAIEIYFTVVIRRYPSYVRTGMLFALIMTALMIADFSKMRVLKSRWYATMAASLAIIYWLAPLGNDYYLTAKGTFEYNMDGLAMYEYMNSREDDIFMIPTGENGGLPALRDSYSIFRATKPGIMRHIVGWGGWSTNNPWVNEAYHSWGIDYPVSQAADDNVYLPATIGKVNSIRTYLMEHHSMSTSAALTTVKYGTTIYKVTDSNITVDEKKGTGIIRNVECSYDSVYETYDISVKFSADTGDINEGDRRVFLSMSDNDGNIKYYMVFNGNDMSLSTENEVLAKVPVSSIENDTKYAINIMTQKDGVNRLICADEARFSLEEYLH